MSLQRMPAEQALERMVGPGGFSAIIDARSEGEFDQDHLPGAVNWPSLNNEQRIVIGTLFKEQGGFEAQKLGAAWVAVNIARHIEREVLSLPKTWQPLIYCWRGGKRSGALSMVLGQIGFQVTVLEGGYKAFRAAMLAWLDRHMAHFRFVVVCGTTGSGKTACSMPCTVKAPRCWTWRLWPATAARCWGACRGWSNPAKSALTCKYGMPCA